MWRSVNEPSSLVVTESPKMYMAPLDCCSKRTERFATGVPSAFFSTPWNPPDGSVKFWFSTGVVVSTTIWVALNELVPPRYRSVNWPSTRRAIL